MTISSNGYTESTIHVGGTGVSLLRGGSGRPLLVLHEELGHPGWFAWHKDLAQDHSLLLAGASGVRRSYRGPTGSAESATWQASIRGCCGR